MYWEDYYEKNPNDALRTESGEILFNTGDPLIDKWESELAKGLQPDLMEGLPPEERLRRKQSDEKIKRIQQQGQFLNSSQPEPLEGFNDNYLGQHQGKK